MTTVAEQIGALLGQLGAGHCFGVVGSGNFHVTNALRSAGVPFTAARHEGGASTMADAYARMSDSVALVSLHQGCGLTNAATGIGEAAKSDSPVLVLAAEASRGAVHSNFAMDQAGFATSLGAAAHRVHTPETAIADVMRAYRTALRQRTTVVLNLPLDVQAAPAVGSIAGLHVEPARTQRPDPRSLTEFVELLEASERPVFIAGRGGRGAKSEITALAQQSGALLATSAVAKGLFNDDPYNLGISGGFSAPLTAELITDADLIVAFGTALNMWTMRGGKLIGADTKIVQIDVNDAAIGAHRPVDVGVVADAGATATDAMAALSTRQPPRYRTADIAKRIATGARWDQTETEDLSVPGQLVDPREVSKRLNELLPTERVVAIDSGNFMGYPSQYLDVPDEFGFCFTQAFQSIGLGLYTAIGAAFAQPGRLPVLGTGDGGFLMSIQELETAVRYRIPLVVLVYNDAAYGAEVHHFTGDTMDNVVFPDTDIAAIARGFGADGITVREVADLAPMREWLDSSPTAPLVIDAKIANDGGAWWLAEAFQGH
ncbi:thiamine pyrophosphate-binding protein [Enteractinococcus fodinae]|uniref:Thiamine pyrophosphate-dependent acetolactate synthase large subunit-like protein n=1 Tax=Enteractinococcus fodinae TaxID=684663 RepID=A0ABU2B041_9MICC|nr:thiamine pyrophosphate-binding protein [Enteractinococcus fodinae]MDR7346158.1 thiamine pyrophosphate-dependent acetolactate synthase large subunit-like protein [Enteractinococcus fodinae]